MNERLWTLILVGCVTIAFTATLPGQGAGGINPKEIVGCDDSRESDPEGAGKTYITVGHKCTSSSDPLSKKPKAVEDANKEFEKGINNAHTCAGCPSGQTGCAPLPLVANPDPPYAESDCTFQFIEGCDGSPIRTDVIATCTATIYWKYECDTCTSSSGGGG